MCAAVPHIAHRRRRDSTAPNWPRQWRHYVDDVDAALAAGRRGDALELFLRLAGSSDEEVAGARSAPVWAGLEASVHTLAYDAACLGDGAPPVRRLAAIEQPTVVATGTEGRVPGAPSWLLALDAAADAIVECIPHAEGRTFGGQSHVADPTVVAPLLTDFFQR